MSKQLRVLLVEDSEDDALLLTRELKKGGYKPTVERVETSETMQSALQEKTWDVIISDYLMPKFSGMEALKVFQKSGLDLPFIIVSGKIGEDTAVEFMKAGAHDYIMKSNLKRLIPAIERELSEVNIRRERTEIKGELHQSYEDLEKTNKRLQSEIIERKKAEQGALTIKQHLQNVIDSATELIISIDRNNRITTWNKTAEELTGYKDKEVVNRSINKLPLFDDPKLVLDISKSIYSDMKLGYSNITILTKNNVKKIIRVTGSVIESENQQSNGVLFMGKDITRDLETHGKLLAGTSYLILDKTNYASIDLLNDMVLSGHKGLFITRVNPDMVKTMHLPSAVTVMVFSQEHNKQFVTISDLTILLNNIKLFCEKHKDAVILLDGIHYAMTRFSFEKFIETLFRINDIIGKKRSMLFLRFDPEVLEKNQMAIIENEFRLLPSQKIEGLIIEDDVYDVLKYIYEQNQNNSLVSFKKIMARFKISYSTAAKRLEILEEKSLIFTKRQGKLRTVYISEKGKTLFHKRESA